MHRWLVLMGAPGHASGLFENPQFVGFHKVKNHGRYWRRLCRYRVTGGCMAYLLRIVFSFVLLLLSAAPPGAHAYPATQTNSGACTVAPCYEFHAATPTNTAYSATYYPSAMAAVNAEIAAANASTQWWTYSFVSISGTTSGSYVFHTVSRTSGANGGDASRSYESRGVAPASPVYACQSGGSLSGSSCVCTAPLVDTGSACSDPNVAKCGTFAGGADLFSGFTPMPVMGSAFCPSDGSASSCAATITGGFAIVKNGVKSWTYEVGYTGATCTPPAAGTTGAQTDCRGTVGAVNGVTVCSPPSDRNTVESIKSTTATDPVSAASAPGSGGSTTTQEATQCTGSKCSTTTTTTSIPAGGGAATVTVKTEDVPKDDYCRDNPRAIMCLTSGFGGSCSGGFVCEGDAVQCATAREIHTRNCRMFDQDSAESLLYGTEKNKTGSQVANENVALSSASFDTSDAIGGSAACITDKVVTVMGSPITIPFSGVCVHLAMLGNVLLTVSFLLAGRIFMRG